MVQASDTFRLRVEIHGAVQGVGFRPFVFRLAEELGLQGWVLNDAHGVFIEVEGPTAPLERFRERLHAEKPPQALIQSIEVEVTSPVGYTGFEIRDSEGAGERTALMLPDIATCPRCLAEVLDPANRRHRYPFTNCTDCGPRFTILESLPYDRPHTTMRGFAMCETCRTEYEAPRDRRFHAQPNACPACGPRLMLLAPGGGTLARSGAAFAAAVRALREGRIVAVKGLGGYHLMCDARDGDAVNRLREKKPRREKPFALLMRDLEMTGASCVVSALAARHLVSAEAPILLLPRRDDAPVAVEVAPGNPWLGVMLPSNPLQHLLARECGFPLVATSGNRSDEPICTDEDEALHRLGGVAELFLAHDRPIARHMDDSVGWVFAGSLRLLRRARGYAPLPVPLPRDVPTILAVGAHLKNTVTLSVGRQAFVSQHIGDLDTAEAQDAFSRVIEDFEKLYDVTPVAIAHDLHPDYVSTAWAIETAEEEHLPRIPVQHHHAHLAACLAENGVAGRALGIIWDGTGHGTDGTVWGGEFLLGDAADFERVGHLWPFRLPGGDAAVADPRRVALALLWEAIGPEAMEDESLPVVGTFSRRERDLIGRMILRGVNAPRTTSMGRLFDGVAALAGMETRVTYEGQAAMNLEFAADAERETTYGMRQGGGVSSPGEREPIVLDWRGMILELVEDVRRGTTVGATAARFHNTLVRQAASVALRIGEPRVALSGGCFQNRRLTADLAAALERQGHTVLLHAQVPPNDGGISLGQVAVAAARLAGKEES